MAQFIAAKSDQLNAEDLIGGPRTITITRVTGNADADQPVNIFFQGDGGKPWRPCKTMRRALVRIWKADASKYVGRSLTLYRDPKVKFGGLEVGGIRISEASHIDQPVTMALLASQKKMQAVTINPMTANRTTGAGGESPAAMRPQSGAGESVAPASGGRIAPEQWLDAYRTQLAAASDLGALAEVQQRASKALAKLSETRPDLHQQAIAAGSARLAELTGSDDDASSFDEEVGA